MLLRWTLTILLAEFLLSSPISPEVSATENFTARIVSVYHPAVVAPCETFPVKLLAYYSHSVLVDVGIFDLATLEVVQSLTLISTFVGPGEVEFQFNLTAPESEGAWRLQASTRAWWENAWYDNPSQTTFNFTVQVSKPKEELFIRFETNRPDAYLEIDGVRYPLPRGSISVRLSEGLHTLYAQPAIEGLEGERFIFQRWSDNFTCNPRTIIFSDDCTISWLYSRQFRLTIISDRGVARGAGWYYEGAIATFGVPSVAYSNDSQRPWGSRFVFAGWSGDSDAMTPVASILMDGPKTIIANWTIKPEDITLADSLRDASNLMLNLAFLIILFSIGSIFLRSTRKIIRMCEICFLLAILLLPAISSISPLVLAQPRDQTVRVADSLWHYWSLDGSDTLLIWLGGGISYGDTYAVNPFSFESYNTMRFVHDLSRYYSVMALSQGPSLIRQEALNRTIYALDFPSSFNYLREIRRRALNQGYSYVYLIGYSIGAIVAAIETTIDDPVGWASPNGVILITIPVEQRLIAEAPAHRSNTLLLSGEGMPVAFNDLGREYLERIPPEGWHEGRWLHKEAHVIEEVSHEVWTRSRTGEYDERALCIVVSFIERCKSLHFKIAEESICTTISNLSQADAEEIAEPNVSLTSVYGPDHVRSNQLFRVHATLRGVDERSLTLVLFDMLLKKILATFTIPSMRTGIGIVGLNVLSPQTEGRMILAVILLYWNGKDWSLLRKAYPAYVEVAVSNSVRLSVIAPYRQVSVTFDDKRIPAGQNGIIIIEASPGLHTLSVDEVYYIDDRTRVVFAQWSDGSRSPHRLIDLKRDVILGVHYVKQFLVMALTRFGNVSGVGWYDANSTVTLTLAPPVVEVNDEGIQVAYVFSHWEHDKALNDSAITFSLTSPMDVRAVWVKLTLSNGETSGELPWASFFFSVTFLALSILIGLKAVWKWFRSISVSNRRTAT